MNKLITAVRTRLKTAAKEFYNVENSLAGAKGDLILWEP